MPELGHILSRLEADLGPVTGVPEVLEGGITNRNFRLRCAERDCVVRVTGSATELLGIDRGAERQAGQTAAALGIGPAVLATGDGYLVTELVAGAPISGEQLRADPAPAARTLRAFHGSGLRVPKRFWVPELLEDYAAVVESRGRSLPAEYATARELVARIADVLPLREPCPCHNDLLAANVLAGPRSDRVMLVDWEYAGMGHRMFDLGNLAVNNDFDDEAERRLLEAYFDRPPAPARRAALALMRIMSDAREAAWGLVQAVISELEFDFTDYARRHFVRLADAAGDPRLERWLAVAAGQS